MRESRRNPFECDYKNCGRPAVMRYYTLEEGIHCGSRCTDHNAPPFSNGLIYDSALEAVPVVGGAVRL